MRVASDLPPRRRRLSQRGRIALALAVGGLLILLMSLRELSGIYTDYLWFDSLDQSDIWWTKTQAKVLLVVAFSAFFFAVLWLNLWIADRQAPTFRPMGPEEELLVRYHEAIGERQGVVRIAVAAFFAFVAGSGVSAEWQTWLAFVNATSFGEEDAIFGQDASFYVFQLPFLSYLVTWLFAALVIVILITAGAHYLNGGIRVQVDSDRISAPVKAHMSVLFALLATVKALDYLIQRYELTTARRGDLRGVFFTDLNAQLPALELLALIAMFAVGLFLANIRRRGWVLPGIAVGLWVFVQVMVAGLYPNFVQRFQVEPQGSSQEAAFIANNIEATRQAFGLVAGNADGANDIETITYEYSPNITPDDLLASAASLSDVRLSDPDVIAQNLNETQKSRGFLRFIDLDVDRYEIDGKPSTVLVGTREINSDSLPDSGWEIERLSYTHGHGLVVADGNEFTDGDPDLLSSGVPVESVSELALDRPQIYFGEGTDGYVIVGTNRPEAGPTESVPPYAGEAGVPLDSRIRRAAFALDLWEIEPLISGLINEDSSVILYRREIRERLRNLAPFLAWDSDPYPVVVDGRLVFVVDGYTHTNRYPNSQSADVDKLPANSGLRRDLNYVRASVKAVVDAYDGTVEFFRSPTIASQAGGDPILATWDRAYPGLIKDEAEIPEQLRRHLRYPEDLFRLQTLMWGRYHLDDVEKFFTSSDAWIVSPDPIPLEGTPDPLSNGNQDPHRQMMALPQVTDDGVEFDGQGQFVLSRAFVPVSEEASSVRTLSSYMVALSDGPDYGRLVVYVPTSESEIPGPALIADDMSADPVLSEAATELGGAGSTIPASDLLVLPVGDSLLYVRTLYIAGEGPGAPKLRRVIVSVKDDLAMAEDLGSALIALFADEPNADEYERVVLEILPETDADGASVTGDPLPDGVEPDEDEPDPPTTLPSLPPEEELRDILRDFAELGSRAESLLADLEADADSRSQAEAADPSDDETETGQQTAGAAGSGESSDAHAATDENPQSGGDSESTDSDSEAGA